MGDEPNYSIDNAVPVIRSYSDVQASRSVSVEFIGERKTGRPRFDESDSDMDPLPAPPVRRPKTIKTTSDKSAVGKPAIGKPSKKTTASVKTRSTQPPRAAQLQRMVSPSNVTKSAVDRFPTNESAVEKPDIDKYSKQPMALIEKRTQPPRAAKKQRLDVPSSKEWKSGKGNGR